MKSSKNWLRTSILGTCGMIPPLLSFPFFRRNFGMPLDVIVIWYFVGVCATILILLWRFSRIRNLVEPRGSRIAQMLGVGLLFVGTAYGLQFWAVGIAPNPGLPTGLYSVLGPVVFFASIAVGKIRIKRIQRHFGKVERRLTQVVGVLLLVPGSILISAGTDLNIGSWLGLTLIAIPLMTVGQLGVKWFKEEYYIPQEVVMMWYFCGTILTILGWVVLTRHWTELFRGFPWGIAGMLGIGLTSGAAGNWLLFRAIGDAPNPGLAYSVYSGSGIGTYLAAILGVWAAPEYFPSASSDPAKLLGIAMVAVGVLLLAGMWEYLLRAVRAQKTGSEALFL